jgi:putative ABC transport system permease protein
MNWKVGTRFRFISRSAFGVHIPLKIVGVLPQGLWDWGLVIRSDYLKDMFGNHDTVNLMYVKVPDELTGKRLASIIEQRFARHQPEVRVETESSAVARFVGRNAAVLAVMNAVVGVLLVDILLVLGNSISISAQERRSEMAVLKVIGFQPRQIMLLIVAEAVLVSTVSSAIGAACVYALSELNRADMLPTRILFLALFPVPREIVIHGLILGIFLGVAGSFIPAWNTRKIRVADVFSQVV